MPLSRRLAVALAAVLALNVSVSALAAGDAAHGKVISYTCLGCHGIADYHNAYPDYAVPKLAGQHAGYIVAALKEYRLDQRAHPTMQVQAATLSDQDIEDIAAYFSSQVTVKTGLATTGNPPAKVAQLCVACHGKDGVGVTDAYPTLTGQHDSYLEQALKEYQLNQRQNPVMGTFVKGLSADDIAEVAEYYAAQSPGLKTLERRLTFLSAKASP